MKFQIRTRTPFKILLLQPRLGYGEGKYLCIYIYLLRPKIIKLIKLFPKAVTETKTNIYNKYYLLGKSRNVTHESKQRQSGMGIKWRLVTEFGTRPTLGMYYIDFPDPNTNYRVNQMEQGNFMHNVSRMNLTSS